MRDVDLAAEFGFRGALLGIYPTGGGFDVDHHQRHSNSPSSSRVIIALKGIMRRQKVGRATLALDAIEKCRSSLADSEIVIYSADEETIEKADRLKARAGVNVRLFPPSSHEEFVRLLGKARISIGLNISDGTPNTMLESMMMGAFPIQSDTGSTGK